MTLRRVAPWVLAALFFEWNFAALEPSVVTVGMIHGGERFNIIPAEVTALCNAAKSGDTEKAKELDVKWHALFQALFMETNPILDVSNRTAQVAVSLAASLFGKSIL